MYSSNDIKENTILLYRNYSLNVISKHIGSVRVKNTKKQIYNIDTKLILEDLRLGLCKIKK